VRIEVSAAETQGMTDNFALIAVVNARQAKPYPPQAQGQGDGKYDYYASRY